MNQDPDYIYPVQPDIIERKTNPIENIIVGNITSESNFRKTLFDLVNAISSKKYSISTADFIGPTRAQNNSQRNTTIKLVELPDFGLFNPRLVQYNRIHTSRLGSLLLYKGNSFKISELITQINAKLNTTILATELEDFMLPAADANGNVSVTLLFNDTSFRYYSGQEITVKDFSSDGLVTKESLGLDRVDNTADYEKPMSIPQLAAAAAAKVSIEDYVNQYVSTEIAKLPNQSGTGVNTQTLWSTLEW